MVLVKMLMEIDPLPMRGSLVMTKAMISPSRREVSPVEQLRQSPRLIPPRFRLVAAESRPECLLMIFFFLNERLHIAEDGHRRATRGPMRQGRTQGGRACPTLVARVWPPSGTSCAQYFLYILEITSVKFQDFWSCAE